jgi:hypothetical protein
MNANNRLILILGVNLPIRDGTTIAITGLQGSQTSDGSVSVTLLDSSAELSPSNDNWRQTSGTLTTTVASVKSPTLKNIQLVFALRNPLVSQTAPLPTLTVTWDSGLVISQSLNGSRALLTCKTGFFGSNCQFKCQSPREVNIAGYCGCPRGSFGANCEKTVTASGESQVLVQVGEAKNLKLTDGTGIAIGAGALPYQVTVAVRVYDFVPDTSDQAQNLTSSGAVVVFEPHGLKFAKPVTITLKYDPTKVPDGHVVNVYYYNEQTVPKVWEKLETTVVAGSPGLVEAKTTHFSSFAPFGAPPPPPPPLPIGRAGEGGG